MAERAKIKKQGGILLPELKKVALADFIPGHPEGDDCIHPSEMAKSDWCPRATYYRLATGKAIETDTFSFTMESIFEEGHSVERKWQNQMRKTGKLWGTWKCLVCGYLTGNQLEPEPSYCGGYVRVHHIWEYKEVALMDAPSMIAGHEDGAMCTVGPADYILDPPGYLVECKTIGVGTVRRDAPKLMARNYNKDAGLYDYDSIWRDLRRPFSAHVRQANVYLWLAKQMGLHFDTCQLLYEYKFNQQTKEFTIKLTDSIIEPLLEKARSALPAGFPPPCQFGGCAQCMAYEEAQANGTRRVRR